MLFFSIIFHLKFGQISTWNLNKSYIQSEQYEATFLGKYWNSKMT